MTKRPRTIVVSVRCDIRDLAVCALWLNEQGQLPDSIGSLTRKLVEIVSDMVRSKDDKYSNISTSEALSLIRQMGLRKGERNQSSLIKQLELEDIKLEGPSMVTISQEQLSDIAEEVTLKSGHYSKEEMDRITEQLGGVVDGESEEGD